MQYILEVADWCVQDRKHKPPVLIAAPDDTAAIDQAVDILGDPYNWAILPPEATAWAWPDGHTIRGWNFTGPRGTHQMRLRKDT